MDLFRILSHPQLAGLEGSVGRRHTSASDQAGRPRSVGISRRKIRLLRQDTICESGNLAGASEWRSRIADIRAGATANVGELVRYRNWNPVRGVVRQGSAGVEPVRSRKPPTQNHDNAGYCAVLAYSHAGWQNRGI